MTKNVDITMVRGDTCRVGINVRGAEGGTVSALYFSVKQFLQDTDYLIQKSLGNGIEPDSTDEGIRYIVTILPEDTEGLQAQRNYVYDIEATVNGDVITPVIGHLAIVGDVTRHLTGGGE